MKGVTAREFRIRQVNVDRWAVEERVHGWFPRWRGIWGDGTTALFSSTLVHATSLEEAFRRIARHKEALCRRDEFPRLIHMEAWTGVFREPLKAAGDAA